MIIIIIKFQSYNIINTETDVTLLRRRCGKKKYLKHNENQQKNMGKKFQVNAI